MARRTAARPSAHLGVGRGEPATLEPHDHRGFVRLPGDRHRPGVTVRPRDGQVAPDADDRGRVQLAGQGRDDQVRGERLAGGAEVESRVGRHPDRVLGQPEAGPGTPPGGGGRRHGAGVDQLAVVAVVAPRHELPAQEGMHQAVGGPGRVDGDADRGDQQRVHLDPVTGPGVGAHQVRVVAESAAGAVHLGQDGLGQPAGPSELTWVARRDVHVGPEGSEGLSHGVSRTTAPEGEAAAARGAPGAAGARSGAGTPGWARTCRRRRPPGSWRPARTACVRRSASAGRRSTTLFGNDADFWRATAASYFARALAALAVAIAWAASSRACFVCCSRAAVPANQPTAVRLPALTMAVREETPRRNRSRLREGVMRTTVGDGPARTSHPSFKFGSWSRPYGLTRP